VQRPLTRPLTLLLIMAGAVLAELRDRVERTRAAWREHPDGGYTNESVVVTALLVGAAIVVIGIIVAKVTSKAHDIDLGP
jgi:hypothetical protein